MTWIAPDCDRQGLLTHVPQIAENFTALYQSVWNLPHIPASTLELCRLRLAQLHKCESEWRKSEANIAAEKRDELERWTTSTILSAAEKACLEFTEVYAMDTQAISDEQADAVKKHYADAGLVALVEALGIFDGMTRLSLLWQLPAE